MGMIQRTHQGAVHWALYLYPENRRTLCGKDIHSLIFDKESCYYMNEVRANQDSPVTCFECNMEYMYLYDRYVASTPRGEGL